MYCLHFTVIRQDYYYYIYVFYLYVDEDEDESTLQSIKYKYEKCFKRVGLKKNVLMK